MYDFIRGTKEFQFDEACEQSIIVLVERIKNKTSFIVVRAGNQMWPIIVFEVATECTEVKFTCTTCDTCELEKISKSMVNVTSAYPGVIRELKQTDAAAVNQQISIQKDSRPSEFSRPLTSFTLQLNENLNVTAAALVCLSSLLPGRASALDFKDTSAPRFGHSDVVFDLFLEARFAFNRPLIQFLWTFLAF